MKKIDELRANIGLINEWRRLDGILCRKGINPKNAIRQIQIYNKVNYLYDDGFNKEEAYNEVSKQIKLSKKTIKAHYLKLNMDITE